MEIVNYHLGIEKDWPVDEDQAEVQRLLEDVPPLFFTAIDPRLLFSDPTPYHYQYHYDSVRTRTDYAYHRSLSYEERLKYREVAINVHNEAVSLLRRFGEVDQVRVKEVFYQPKKSVWTTDAEGLGFYYERIRYGINVNPASILAYKFDEEDRARTKVYVCEEEERDVCLFYLHCVTPVFTVEQPGFTYYAYNREGQFPSITWRFQLSLAPAWLPHTIGSEDQLPQSGIRISANTNKDLISPLATVDEESMNDHWGNTLDRYRGETLLVLLKGVNQIMLNRGQSQNLGCHDIIFRVPPHTSDREPLI